MMNNHHGTNQSNEPNRYNQRKASSRMYLFTCSALLSSMAMGSVIGWSSDAVISMARNGSQPQLHERDSSDQEIKSWISSSITLGALAGSFISSFLIKLLGRRVVLVVMGLPFAFGWLIISFAKSFFIVTIGRVVTGFCAGIASSVAPGYVAEIVTPSTRGFLGSCFQLFCSLGIEFSACFGAFFAWNVTPLPSSVLPILCSFGMFFAPESPQSLADQSRMDEAREALQKLRSSDSDVDEELEELKQRSQRNKENVASSSGWRMLKRVDVYKPAIIIVLLQFLKQFSGVNAIMFYLTQIFEESGSSIDPEIASMLVNVAFIVACLISGIVTDRTGRKFLLILSNIGNMLSMAMMGYYYWRITPQQGWIPIVCLIVFVCFYSFGLGPIPWMIAGETSPSEASNLIGSLSSASNWLGAFLITKEFKATSDLITKAGTYFAFAVFNLITALGTWLFIPETKGKSIEQMQKYFLKN